MSPSSPRWGMCATCPQLGRDPREARSEPWSKLGVDVEHDFQPLYIVPKEKRDQIRKLKKAMEGIEELFLATDEDRRRGNRSPGISPRSWRRKSRCDGWSSTRSPARAIRRPSPPARDRPASGGGRRSPPRPGPIGRLRGVAGVVEDDPARLSAGRVQSVAVRLVVQREWERIRFRSAGYWDVVGTFVADSDRTLPFPGTLVEVDGRRLATGARLRRHRGR